MKTKTVGTYFGTMSYPKSEKTIINHNFNYKGLKYVNDMGHPCEYRIEGTDKMVKYYKGSLLAEYIIK